MKIPKELYGVFLSGAAVPTLSFPDSMDADNYITGSDPMQRARMHVERYVIDPSFEPIGINEVLERGLCDTPKPSMEAPSGAADTLFSVFRSGPVPMTSHADTATAEAFLRDMSVSMEGMVVAKHLADYQDHEKDWMEGL